MRKRRGYKTVVDMVKERKTGQVQAKVDLVNPHNVPLVILGTGLLWFGWMGFK